MKRGSIEWNGTRYSIKGYNSIPLPTYVWIKRHFTSLHSHSLLLILFVWLWVPVILRIIRNEKEILPRPHTRRARDSWFVYICGIVSHGKCCKKAIGNCRGRGEVNEDFFAFYYHQVAKNLQLVQCFLSPCFVHWFPFISSFPSPPTTLYSSQRLIIILLIIFSFSHFTWKPFNFLFIVQRWLLNVQTHFPPTTTNDSFWGNN